MGINSHLRELLAGSRIWGEFCTARTVYFPDALDPTKQALAVVQKRFRALVDVLRGMKDTHNGLNSEYLYALFTLYAESFKRQDGKVCANVSPLMVVPPHDEAGFSQSINVNLGGTPGLQTLWCGVGPLGQEQFWRDMDAAYLGSDWLTPDVMDALFGREGKNHVQSFRHHLFYKKFVVKPEALLRLARIFNWQHVFIVEQP